MIFYILNLFISYISFFLTNIPLFTIYKFQLWRLITNVFITTSLLNIIFAFLSWIKDAIELENRNGTLKYMIIFFINSIFIQIIYCFILVLCYLLTNNKLVLTLNIIMGKVENNGIWPLIMGELTLLCMTNPEVPMRVFFFPCEVKAKYYPIVLFFLFVMFNGMQIDFGVLSGIIYGLLYHYLLRNKLQITDQFIQKLEISFLFKWMIKLNGFVSLSNSFNPNIPVVIAPSNNNVEISSSENIQNPNSGFSAFRGKGVAVGGSLGINNGEYSNVSQNSSDQ
jgi:membrane associated rhomboid family serine protease